MATLEKIRSKSVLLLVIVGAALLAFIIGDFFTSGRTLFGPGTTIAKVGNQKVDVQEFQRRVQEATQQAQTQGRKIDSAVLQQQVLNSMIAEALFNQEIKDLGIVVTDDELTRMMVGENSAYVDQMVRQQMGAESAQALHDMAYNPGKYGISQEQAVQLQQYWVSLEKQVEQMLLQQKFQNLFNGTMVANDLDTRALYDDNAATAHILYAKKDFASLDDAKYEVSDAELRDAYNKDRNRYKLDDDVRSVSYIAVDIVPSNDDIIKGQQKVEDAIAALNAQPETQGLADMPDFVVDRKKYTQKNIESQPRLKAFADSAAVGKAALVNKVGNDYTIAKLLGRPSEVDGATIDFMMVEGSRASIDSLVTALNAGASFDSIAANPLVASSQKDIEVSLVDPNYATVKEVIENAQVGQFFTPDTMAQNGRIFRVTKRDDAAPVYDLAVVTYTTEPSNATVNTLQANLQKYVTENKTSADFAKNATDAGYSTFPAQVSASSPQLGGMTDSHSAVAWAMDAKKGEVSPVFGDITSGKFIAVALNDIYDDGFVPVRDTQLATSLTARVRNDKKAADLIAQYKGKANDINGYAKLMDARVDTTTVNFGQFMIPGLGMNESEIMGVVANAKENTLLGPIQGNNGVVVVYVTGIDKSGRPFNADESAIRFNQQRGAARLGNNINNILIGNKKVTNNMNTFYK